MTYSTKISEILSVKTAGIAGAGGLGSNVAAALVRSGIGKLIIADFDTVSLPNLNRQFYFAAQTGMKKCNALKENLLAINPLARIEVHDCRVTPQNASAIFSECNIVVEAFDSAEEKSWFAEYMTGHFPAYPLLWIGTGRLGGFERLKIQQADNLYVCGDQESDALPHAVLTAPRVSWWL
jgi:sulfur carrier protein ThiS adenylyltransferase